MNLMASIVFAAAVAWMASLVVLACLRQRQAWRKKRRAPRAAERQTQEHWQSWKALCLALVLAGCAAALQAQTRAPVFRYEHVHLVRVIDGDTVVVNVEIAPGLLLLAKHVRLARIDAPELRGAQAARGRQAKGALEKLLAERPVLIVTLVPESRAGEYSDRFGRWIALLEACRVKGEEPRCVDAGQHLQGLGLARKWERKR